MEKYTNNIIQPVRTYRPTQEESIKALTNFLRYWYDGCMNENFIQERMICSGYHYLLGYDPLLTLEEAYSIVMAALNDIFPKKEETV